LPSPSSMGLVEGREGGAWLTSSAASAALPNVTFG
jgi:hypothetical protein